jgi:hypothetical protein
VRLPRLAEPIRARAAAESRPRRLAWVAVAVVLTAVPFAFNAARAASFSASVDLFPTRVGAYPLEVDPAYWRRLGRERDLWLEMYRNTGARPAEYRDAALRALDRPPRVRLTVEAPSPARAQELVNALGPQLVGASARTLAVRIDRDIEATRAALPEARGAEARALQRRLRRLRGLDARTPFPPPRAVMGQPAARPPIRGWADRVADAMPGTFPSRPSPVWAGLAGLLLALTAWGIALALVPPRPGRAS